MIKKHAEFVGNNEYEEKENSQISEKLNIQRQLQHLPLSNGSIKNETLFEVLEVLIIIQVWRMS